MSRNRHLMKLSAAHAALLIFLGAAGCSDVLRVPPPKDLQTAGDLDTRSGAEARFFTAKADMFRGLSGRTALIEFIGLLTDEFENARVLSGSGMLNIDARATTTFPETYGEPATWPLYELFSARSTLLLTVPFLLKHEPLTEQHRVGEAYALAGFVETMIAEAYCAGATLDRVLPEGGWEWGMPLSTDSLFGVAEAHFQLALSHANGDANVTALANAGLARARLGRGRFAEAAAAAALVPTSFVYNIATSPTNSEFMNFYLDYSNSCSSVNTANNEGGNGLDFVSAQDPRLVVDSALRRTCDLARRRAGAKPWYYPVKFGDPSSTIPLASGIQARLVEAEAALRSGDASWLAILNDLRTTSGGVAGMSPLTDPGTDAARVDLLFRERAFWLFGTGTRLGDLRRLIRQYGRSANAVFPTGPYANGVMQTFPSYGDDVSLTLPTPAGGFQVKNPNYRGCLEPTTEG